MASIFQRQGSPYWYGRFQYKGSDTVFSTGIKIKGADKHETKENKGKALEKLKDKQYEVRGQVSLSDMFERLLLQLEAMPDEDDRNEKRVAFARQLMRTSTCKLALDDAWEAWKRAPKKRDPAPNTLKSYKRYWDDLTNWLSTEHAEVEYLHEITDGMGKGYFSHLWASGVASGTYNRTLRVLRATFNGLGQDAGLTSNPFRKENVPDRKNDSESRRCLTPAELEKVCKEATGDIRYMLGLGLYLGMRLGDVCRLRWCEDPLVRGKKIRLGPDLDTGSIRYMPSKTARKKKIVSARLHPILHALLVELRQQTPADAEHLFPEMAERYKKDDSSVSKLIGQHFRNCGIQTSEASGHGKRAVARVGFHSLRHSLVSLCSAGGVPVQAIMQLVGHGNPLVQDIYTHMQDGDVAKYVNPALPELIFANGESEKE